MTDRQRHSLVVEVDRLKAAIVDELSSINEPVILDGHLSHQLSPTHIIVVRASPQILAERMGRRDYSPQKIRENVEAEYLGVCQTESLRTSAHLLEVDGGKPPDLDGITEWLANGGRKSGLFDWRKEFMDYLKSTK